MRDKQDESDEHDILDNLDKEEQSEQEIKNTQELFRNRQVNLNIGADQKIRLTNQDHITREKGSE